jgi:hypothetical protein
MAATPAPFNAMLTNFSLSQFFQAHANYNIKLQYGGEAKFNSNFSFYAMLPMVAV